MRIDLTLRDSDGALRDVAVLGPPETRPADVTAVLTPRTPLTDVRIGAVLAAEPPCGHDGPRFTATHRLDVVGGLDSGRGVPLGRVPLTVGRATGSDLVLHDPDVSRQHAEVALTAHGPTVRDRGSRNGTSVDGHEVGADAVPVRAGRYVRLGDTFLGVSGATRPAALTKPGPNGTVLVNRPPSPASRPAVEEITLPTVDQAARPQRIGWIAALIPAAAGIALAMTLHAPQFLLFSLLSPIALLATAFGDRMHWRRERRKGNARYRSELAASRQHIERTLARETSWRRARDPDPATVLHTAQLPGVRLWERSRGSAGLLRVRVGLGDVPSHTRLRDATVVDAAGTVSGVPVAVDLVDGPLGVCGPHEVALGVARWIVGQLATDVSPDDLTLALVLSTEAESSWHWARWLPHLRGQVAVDADERRALVAELAELIERRSRPGRPDAPWPGAWLLVIVDRGAGSTDLDGLSELLTDSARVGITALCVSRAGGLPAACATVVQVTGETGSRIELRPPTGAADVVADRVSVEWAVLVARALAPLRDSGPGRTDAVPDSCALLPLLMSDEPSPNSVLTRWNNAPPGLSTVLGVAADGPLTIDLVHDGPHALVAGTTGAGKSELLRSLVAGLAVRHPPESVAFVLVDYKGGAAFADCAQLPHTVGVITDLDSHLAERALVSLERELTRREELFARRGVRDLDEYRAAAPDEPVPRLVIVIDEFAELAAELGDFLSGLVGIARRGRSLGVHLVLATQRPSGVVSPEIRANTALRIALRVTDPTESRDVIDADTAATIGRRQPGRAYLRLPGAPLVLLQTAHVGASASSRTTTLQVVRLGPWRRLPAPTDENMATPTDLALLVDAARIAAARSERPLPRRPWLPPLPDQVALGELAPGGDGRLAIGRCDLPRAQQQVPLLVDLRADGSWLFAGGPRSGRTSALLTLAIAAAHDLPPDRLHVYAIDFAAGGLARLAQLPHAGSIVSADVASAATLLNRMDIEVAERRLALARDPDASLPAVLCVLDGWDTFVTAADEHDSGRTVETLSRLLRSGPSVGLTVAIAGDRATLAVRVSAHVANKLLLKLTDRADYALAGLTERTIPRSFPPGRAVRALDGVEVQLAHLGRDPSPAERDAALVRAVARWAGRGAGVRPPIQVRALPARIRLDDLCTATSATSATPPGAGIVLGVGGDAGDRVVIDLFAGARRLLVAGPTRSGRSTVLCSVLQQATAAGWQVIAAAPARSPLGACAGEVGARLITPDSPGIGLPPGVRTVLLVDDSEQFLDTGAGEALTAWTRTEAPELAVVVAGVSDELAVTFRGVAAEVRRARCTVLLRPGPGDADLAGCPLPRRRSSGPPGRGLLIGDPAWGGQFAAGPLSIQIALP